MPSGRFTWLRSLSAVHHADGAVGAGDDEAPAGEFDVGNSDFEQMGGDRLALLDDLGDRRDHRRATGRRRARTAGAAANDEFVAVALQQANVVEGNAEPARQDLRERRRVALAVVERTGDEGHGAAASKRMPPISLLGGAVTSR